MNSQKNSYRKISNHISNDPVTYSPSDGLDLREHNPSYYSRPVVIIESQYSNGEPAQSTKGIHMFSMTRMQLIGTVIGFFISLIGSIGGFSWYLSNHISNSSNEVRKELQESINMNRQELITALSVMESRSNDRFNRVDYQFDKIDAKFDKVESSFKETNSNLSEIKAMLSKQK
ncbi:hypothetical protein AB6F89_15510 [Providencia hangzhouensis]|uniref:hypothetical protein n=1 Tax=Providencia hangzhouensis TaxID=3031799 RepID=UPI0034DD6A71